MRVLLSLGAAAMAFAAEPPLAVAVPPAAVPTKPKRPLTRRERAVTNAFYAAIRAAAEARADLPFAEATAFVQGAMHGEVADRIVKALPREPGLTAAEVQAILEAREGAPHEACYDTLTCLFVEASAWVKDEDPARVAATPEGATRGARGQDAWKRAPLTPELQEKVWRSASAGRRRDALVAKYASLRGKGAKTFSKSCRACDGRPRARENLLGRVIAAQKDMNPLDAACRRCRGIGISVTVRYR